MSTANLIITTMKSRLKNCHMKCPCVTLLTVNMWCRCLHGC